MYILLYIETPWTILILQKGYAHDTAGRAYMPTQENKKQKDLENYSLPAKMKFLLILEENSRKIEIKLSPLCAISHEN